MRNREIRENHRKKIISIDLDGVLNDYSGNYMSNTLAPVKKGAFEFLEKLSKNYYIEIYTVRNISLCKKWLKDNNLSQFIKDVRDTKNPFSSVFLDDRAVHFDGCYETAYEKIVNFKPFWKIKE